MLHAQLRGAGAVTKAEPKISGTTYAVIVGISDYQNSNIIDLQFAHADAKAFAEYLRSKAGGNVDSSKITLLLNEKATAGNFISALFGLMEECKENDQVIIYFAGHGDVESTTISQPGFLLCWDAPSKVYMSGGTFGLSYLQEIISTLSSSTKAKVIVITDACRSGKLAGSSIGGSQATAANLAKQYANEVKIMSCQPNEFALEGKSWGGGRGVFSYYLLAGLQGLADKNNDSIVNLAEIERFLEDRVVPSAAPHPQNPFTVGSKTTAIAKVDPDILAKLKTMDLDGGLKGTEQRAVGFADLNDSTVLKKMELFNSALETKHLLSSDTNAAWNIYQQVKDIPAMSKYIGLMRRNLAAALQDDTQQAINDYLEANPNELKSRWNFDSKYEIYPDQLLKAAELLGEKHFYYKTLIARYHYFNGLNLRLKAEREGSDSLFTMAIAEQKKCLDIESKSAHALNEIGWIYYLQNKYQEAIGKFKEALLYSPEWILPLTNLSSCYLDIGNIEEAKAVLSKAYLIDSNFMLVPINYGFLYRDNKNFDSSNYYLHKAMAIDSTYATGYFLLSNNYYDQGQIDKAIITKLYGLKYDSINVGQLNTLGFFYLINNNLNDAKTTYLKAKHIMPQTKISFQGIVEYYFHIKDFSNAKNELLQHISIFPKDNYSYYLLSLACVQLKNTEEACDYLNKAVEFGFNNRKIIMEDPLFSEVLKLEQCNQLFK